MKKKQRIEVGEKLKKLRKKNGLSTYDLVNKGVRFEIINNVENGAKNYTIDTFFKYTEAANIDLKDFQ